MKAASLFVALLIGALLTGCASPPSPMTCAAIGATLGGAGGAWAGASHDTGDDLDEAVAFGAAGALVAGGAGYLLCKLFEEEAAPPPEPEPMPEPEPEPMPEPEPAVDPCTQVIRLRGVNFDFDKAEIRPDAAVILDEAAMLLGDALAQCPRRQVKVEGHTDWTGPDGYNQGLSERRASSVRDYLAGKGVSSRSLSAVGYGESQPIATNETREGRALNRRVELRMAD